MATAGLDAPLAISHSSNQKATDDNVSAPYSRPSPSSMSAAATKDTNGHTTQPIATTSAVKVDDPLISSVNSSTPDAIVQSEASLLQKESKKPEEHDEDAKLLASLASGLLGSSGSMSEAAQSQSMATADAFASSSFPHEDSTNMSGLLTSATNEGDTTGPIQAYAKLEFPGFSYYIQTLECTIGRRPAHMRTPLFNDGGSQHVTSATKMDGDVDVDLGLLKSISRLHVRILYQEHSRNSANYPGTIDTFGHRAYNHDGGASSNQGRFVLEVLGRNGCFVDDVPVGKDSIVPLGKRTKIQIAERVFYFVLPPTPSTQRYNSDGELDGDESLGDSDDKEDDSGSLGSSQSDSGSFASLDSDEEREGQSNEDSKGALNDSGAKRRPKLVLKKKVSKEQGDARGKEQGKDSKAGQSKKKTDAAEKSEEDGGEGGANGSKGARKSKAGMSKEADSSSKRKRKRSEKDGEEANIALKVGTPIGVEALNLHSNKMRKKKKKEAEAGVDVKVEEASTSATVPQIPAGKGKGGGKAHIVAAAVAAKAKADEEKLKAASNMATGKAQDAPTSGSIKPPAPSAAAAIPPVRPTVSTSVRPINPASTLAGPHYVSRPGMLPSARPPGTPGIAMARPTPLPMSSASYSASTEGAGVSLPRPPMSSAMSARPPNGVSSSPNSAATAAPFPPSAAAFAHLATPSPASPAKLPTTPQPLPPAGPGIKPALNNLDLIRNALANPTSTGRGGKLTLQEIYEDISSKYEWYRNNNRSNGRDWHSAIRHAVGNSREMVRIPRKTNEQGKGVFYALNTSEAAKVYRKEAEGAGNGYLLNQQITPSASVTPPASAPPMVAQRPPSAAPPAGVPSSSAITPTPPATISLPPPAAGNAPVPHPVQSGARPSPPTQPAGRVSIVIGKAPAEALAQMAATPKAAITQNIEALFGGPPIVHHEGKLFLSPLVFGHMSPSEISDIGGKGAQQALAILQGHLVSHLQGKMKGGGGAAPKAGAAGQPQQRPTPSPASRPRPAAAPVSAPPRSRPVGPGGAVPQNSVRQVSNANMPARPAQPMTNRPPGGAPPSQRPVANYAGRPPIGPTIGNAIRPLLGTSTPGMQTARPAPYQGQAGPARPAGRPLSTVPSKAPSIRPVTTPGPRPAGPPSGPAARPQASVVPASRPPPMARPSAPPLSTQGSSTSSVAPSVPATASNSTAIRPPLPPASPASPAPGPPSSNAMMSAMQALASHPDAAGLMTLLSGGKVDAGTKLTSGQLDLLQQAGRIAAEQQKVQQQRAQEQAKSNSNRPASIAPSLPLPTIQDTKDAPVQVPADKQAAPSQASPSLADTK